MIQVGQFGTACDHFASALQLADCPCRSPTQGGVTRSDNSSPFYLQFVTVLYQLCPARDPHREGDLVEAGEVLARLDPTDYELVLEDRQATYDNARSNFERGRGLITDGNISRMDYDRMEANFRTSSAALSKAIGVQVGAAGSSEDLGIATSAAKRSTAGTQTKRAARAMLRAKRGAGWSGPGPRHAVCTPPE